MGWVMLRMLQLMYSKDDLQVEDKTFGVRQFFKSRERYGGLLQWNMYI